MYKHPEVHEAILAALRNVGTIQEPAVLREVADGITSLHTEIVPMGYDLSIANAMVNEDTPIRVTQAGIFPWGFRVNDTNVSAHPVNSINTTTTRNAFMLRWRLYGGLNLFHQVSRTTFIAGEEDRIRRHRLSTRADIRCLDGFSTELMYFHSASEGGNDNYLVAPAIVTLNTKIEEFAWHYASNGGDIIIQTEDVLNYVGRENDLQFDEIATLLMTDSADYPTPQNPMKWYVCVKNE